MSARTRWTTIDPARVERILTTVTTELSDRFPEISATDVHAVVRQAITDFVCAANVPEDLALLVRRRAGARLLATHPQPVLTPYQTGAR